MRSLHALLCVSLAACSAGSEPAVAGENEHPGGTGGATLAGASGDASPMVMAGNGGGPTVAGGAGVSAGGGAGSSGHFGTGGAPVVDAGPIVDAAPHLVRACPSGSGAVGTWENITPPPALTKSVLSFVIDPHDTATLYVGTVGVGLFKSTDCGATWTHINTGMNGSSLDPGMEGSIAIDPIEPSTLYLDDRYGAMGLFKSTNSGVDWTQILPKDVAHAFIYDGMVEWVTMDPGDRLHLIVSPHFSCQAPHTSSCLLETTDGGTTWRVIDGTPDSTELGGQIILDRTTWLWAQPGGGLYRTTNSGASWTKVAAGQAYPYLHRAANGAYYIPAGSDGVITSTDGIAWSKIPGSPLSESIAASDSTLYTSGGLNANVYSSASLASPTKWSKMTGPPSSITVGGWQLKYDRDHHILFSANFSAGFWRLVTE